MGDPETPVPVPVPPEKPDGSVGFFDDPKIKAVLLTTLVPIVVGAVLRWLKIKSDPDMVNSISAWLVSTIIPGITGIILAVRAIMRRVNAGKDPNNPAKPIAPPTSVGDSIKSLVK